MPKCLSANLALVAVGGVAGAWQAFAVALFEQTTFAAGPAKQEMAPSPCACHLNFHQHPRAELPA